MNTSDLINIAFTAREQRRNSPGPQQPRNRFSYAPVEGSSPHAGIRTADASTPPVRFWPVRFQRGGRSHYDYVEAPDSSTASRIVLIRNKGAVAAQAEREITRDEFDRLTKRRP